MAFKGLHNLDPDPLFNIISYTTELQTHQLSAHFSLLLSAFVLANPSPQKTLLSLPSVRSLLKSHLLVEAFHDPVG